MGNLSQPAVVIIQAVLGVALLTFVMSVCAGLSRMPALKRAGLDLEDFAHVADVRDRLPSSVRRLNDNYNHLLEAPTVFYAASLATVALGSANWIYAACAVAYLVLRTAHSVVQATVNRVSLRAPLYILSWLAMAPLIVGPLIGTMLRS
jgi:hypothetical protein